MKSTQYFVDKFYKENGPCCAGCDHWRYINSVAGECIKTAPVGNNSSMLGMEGCSIPEEPGHILTKREHLCGEFEDKNNHEKPLHDGK